MVAVWCCSCHGAAAAVVTAADAVAGAVLSLVLLMLLFFGRPLLSVNCLIMRLLSLFWVDR